MSTQTAEAALNSTVVAERRLVTELQGKATMASTALERERELVSKLQLEMKQAALDSGRMVGQVTGVTGEVISVG